MVFDREAGHGSRLLFAEMVVRALLLTVAVVLLGGCGGNDDEAPVSSTTTPMPELVGASTEPVVWTGESTETALLTDVRAARHSGYDRVVFEFRNGIPGYDVRYVEPPVRADGSGEEVAVAGSAVLVVRMDPALDADLTQEAAPLTYTGPTRFQPDTAMVVELVRTGGFEAVLTWAIGVDGKLPFLVTRLQDPPRLVIDISTT
jgi:hypothetical protein